MCQLFLTVSFVVGNPELIRYALRRHILGLWLIFAGAFQTYYENTYPSWSASQISWIGSIQAFFLMGFGIVAGPLYDQGYVRFLVWIGSFLCVLGLMLTSISSKYWHFILAQGVMFGLGSGCLFIPSIAVLPAYFDKKQALALGIGASGSALGRSKPQHHVFLH
jgi:MFS family permease